MIDGLEVLDSRQRIERHFTTWINRQVAKEIGHGGQLTIEELCYRLMMLEGSIPDAPTPGVQVAQGNGFVWNETALDEMLYGVWEKKKNALAQKHLSTHAYGVWSGMTRAERIQEMHVYERALQLVRASKHRGDTTGIDQALRMLKASNKPKQGTPFTSNNGKVITFGLCHGCADRATCIGAREGAERCNDFTASNGMPVKRAQTGVRTTAKGQGSIRIAPPLLQVGI